MLIQDVYKRQAHNNTINGDFIIYDNNEIIGGALGYIRWGWYQLTDFYIDEGYRGCLLYTSSS